MRKQKRSEKRDRVANDKRAAPHRESLLVSSSSSSLVITFTNDDVIDVYEEAKRHISTMQRKRDESNSAGARSSAIFDSDLDGKGSNVSI